jgi:L-alanine-DL-glutamate epimerase-like enolase superfamily enzyme
MHIETRQLKIPLRLPFTQASKRRVCSASLLVAVRQDERVGLGEGCPRPYVTGETLSGAAAWVDARRPQLEQLTSLADLQTFAEIHRTDIDANPSAWCAVELALLDLFAQRDHVPVESLLGIDAHRETFTYTGVIPASHPETTQAHTRWWTELGARDFKLKVGLDDRGDSERLAAFWACAPAGARLRLDANNAWGDDPEQARQQLSPLLHGVVAVEEPLAPGRFDDLQALGTALNIPIILDESCTRCTDIQRLAPRQGAWILNLKVSKLGGLLRSTALLKAAVERDIPVIIGAHVGETSVLTRAGVALARAAAEACWAMEGAVGEHLLEADPVQPVLQLSQGSMLHLRGPARPGLGLGLG